MCKNITLLNAERTEMSRVFNPDALNITQVGFVVDSAPNRGAATTAAVVTATDCPESPRGGFTPGVDQMTASSNGTPAVFRIAGSNVALFPHVRQTPVGADRYLDTSALHHLELYGCWRRRGRPER